jgi:lysophospholipase L1-like esterase
VAIWPAASGNAYPTAFNAANAPYLYQYNQFISTQPYYFKPASVPSTPHGMVGLGLALVPGAATWGGGMCDMDDNANYSLCVGAVDGYSIGGGTYNQAIWASNHAHQADVLVCANPTANTYPGASPAGVCEGAAGILPPYGTAYQLAQYDFAYNGLTSTVPLFNLDPATTTSLANKVYVDTAALVRSSPPSRYGVKYGTTQDSWGDSITCGVGSNGTGSCSTSTSYAGQLATLAGYTLTDHGVAGDQACDLANHVFNGTWGTVNTMMIGINNATYKGVGSPETQYEDCLNAAIGMITTSATLVQGNTCTANVGSWTADSTYSVTTGEKASTNGNELTCTISTTTGPIYAYIAVSDAWTGGVFTYQIDSGASVTVNAFEPTAISTQNGATTGVKLVRLPPPVKGSHNVHFTITSATGAANVVDILGVTTTPANVYYLGPNLTLNTVTFDSQNNNWATYAQYAEDVLTVGNQWIADGVDLRLYDARLAMQDNAPSLTYDGLHPSNAGAAAIAAGMLPVVQAPPGPYVNRGTPANSSATCTPGDKWSDAAVTSGTVYDYRCSVNGTIVRSAFSSF